MGAMIALIFEQVIKHAAHDGKSAVLANRPDQQGGTVHHLALVAGRRLQWMVGQFHVLAPAGELDSNADVTRKFQKIVGRGIAGPLWSTKVDLKIGRLPGRSGAALGMEDMAVLNGHPKSGADTALN